MRAFKPGYLLLEVLFALLILSIVSLPWINFLREVSIQRTLTRLDRFFLAKRYFLDALDNPALQGNFHDQRGEIHVIRTPRTDGLKQLQVNVIEKGELCVSLVGVTR